MEPRLYEAAVCKSVDAGIMDVLQYVSLSAIKHFIVLLLSVSSRIQKFCAS